ncbi:MAG: DUF1156 domain-containing protein, partial [Phormidesmis sp. CAN_BIN44]|nr:DUF1156 domain-containing protein [Phormidesmis sp. CAN_BIN44]
MTDSTPKRKPVFIEKIMPVTLLNEQVYYEHGGNPFKGLHRWYSRKPLSFSRASVLGSLLPADVTMEEFEWLLGLNRRVAGMQDKTTKLYKTPPSPDRIQKVQELCEQMWGTKTPTVLDAFAGGGSIPFEAARYGLNVLASDLNPVAVVTMKAAIEYPLKFGADLQVEIDKWVKWVGDEAEKRLAPFFPSLPGEKVQNYFWAHTVKCPNCESIVPLSPNWWLYNRPEKQNLSKWCAVKPIADLKNKRTSFELIEGKKGKGTTIQTETDEFDPDTLSTFSRGTGKCANCGNIIEDEIIKSQAQSTDLGHQLYAVSYRKGKGGVEFRVSEKIDLDAVERAERYLFEKTAEWEAFGLIPSIEIPYSHLVHERNATADFGLTHWHKFFNHRQLLTLVSYVEIINEAKIFVRKEYESEKSNAILTYLVLLLDLCADKNCRLSHWQSGRAGAKRATTQHSLNLFWNYPETNGAGELWKSCAEGFSSDYASLCNLIGTGSGKNIIPGLSLNDSKFVQIDSASADALIHIVDNSVDAIVTDPPYYGTILYAEIADFFYVWQKRTLGDIFPDLFASELTDKDREAVANPSRFRNMGISPEILANQDYEAKMALAFAEYHRVLRDDGVMTVQFNHKDSGAWDVLAKSLIDAGFEITASWA